QVLRKGSVAIADPDDRAHVAMAASGGAAAGARSAADRNLTRDAAAGPRPILRRRLFDNADELVPGHAREAGVAAQQLEVGDADPRRQHADYAFAVGRGLRPLLQR